MLAHARDCVQQLVHVLWQQPVRHDEDAVIAELPEGSTVLPREKPIPKPSPKTRWEQFAAQKGIVKQKRSRLTYDEARQEFLPRFGYRRANDDQRDWLIEVPQSVDPMEDQFEKRREAKRARIAKNARNRERNLDRAERTLSSASQVQQTRMRRVVEGIARTRTATASLGKFDAPLPSEPRLRSRGKKHKARRGVPPAAPTAPSRWAVAVRPHADGVFARADSSHRPRVVTWTISAPPSRSSTASSRSMRCSRRRMRTSRMHRTLRRPVERQNARANRVARSTGALWRGSLHASAE